MKLDYSFKLIGNLQKSQNRKIYKIGIFTDSRLIILLFTAANLPNYNSKSSMYLARCPGSQQEEKRIREKKERKIREKRLV